MPPLEVRDVPQMDILELAYLRRAAYGVLGAMLLHPREELVGKISEAARELRRNAGWTNELAFGGDWERFLRPAERFREDQASELQSEYLSLFGISARPKPIELYESAYLDSQHTGSGELLAELDGVYSSAGLAVHSNNGETPDHAAVELEFMSYLCGLEVQALEDEDSGGARAVLLNQKDFLKSHPCLWFPFVAREVKARGAEGPIALAVHAARALVAHDADFTDAMAAHLSEEHS